MGTDSGAFSGRFPGYFEHLELELMEAAGLPRMAVLQSATSVAADCIGRAAEVGSLKPGLRADFLVLEANPLDDLANTRRIHSVWMDGVQLEF
jgi:imidazolonepropionase-like amidohydrolase